MNAIQHKCGNPNCDRVFALPIMVLPALKERQPDPQEISVDTVICGVCGHKNLYPVLAIMPYNPASVEVPVA